MYKNLCTTSQNPKGFFFLIASACRREIAIYYYDALASMWVNVLIILLVTRISQGPKAMKGIISTWLPNASLATVRLGLQKSYSQKDLSFSPCRLWSSWINYHERQSGLPTRQLRLSRSCLRCFPSQVVCSTSYKCMQRVSVLLETSHKNYSCISYCSVSATTEWSFWLR